MKLRRIEIERFRGIKKLGWNVRGDFVCLVGPGDSTKTTILDAIEYALSPRWSLALDDADFYEADTSQPLRITVTVGDLPDEFKSNEQFGYLTRGWSPQGELHDEPGDGDEHVLSIRLEVDSSLEPSWKVVNDREPEGRRMGSKDREKLGCVRVGDYVDRHFSWGRNSILSRLTGGKESIAATLAGAGRAARSTIAQAALAELRKAAGDAHRLGRAFGVASKNEYRPHLDVEAVSIGQGGLSLHDGEVPLRHAGLGTRRLLAVAMQLEGGGLGGLTLIDEVEHGLEPHRVRHVLRALGAGQESSRHVLMTTHAPVVVEELRASQLRVVRSSAGTTEVLEVPDELQRYVRKASGAFLARKVIVCEGRTEIGVCRRFDERWNSEGIGSFGLAGIALVDGGGSDAPGTATALTKLGYDVLYLGDTDVPLSPNEQEMEARGIRVRVWSDRCALEQRVAKDLPWSGVAEVISKAMELRGEGGEDSVRNAVARRLEIEPSQLSASPPEWLASGVDEVRLRDAVGSAAKGEKNKSNGWFKRVDLAEHLGEIVIRHWDSVRDKDLGQNLSNVREWAHGR